MLRNMFDGVATESTLRRLLSQLHFARTAADQLRVNVDSGTLSQLNQIAWAAGGGYATWYAAGGPNSMDVREQMKAQVRANAQQVRATRWSIT